MILAFKFDCFKEPAFLAPFLRSLAKDLKHSISCKNDQICLKVSGFANELSALADRASAILPYSLFIKHSEVDTADELDEAGEIKKVKFGTLSPSQAAAFLANGKAILNESGVLTWSKFEGEITLGNFNEKLKACLNLLKNGKGVCIEQDENLYEISFGVNFDANFLMPVNLKQLPKIFIADDRALTFLASFEKPLLALKTTAIYRQNHEDAPLFFDVMAPNDLFLYAICEQLNKEGFSFLSVKVKEQKNAISRLTLLESSAVLSPFFYAKNEEFELSNFGDIALGLKFSKFSDDEICLLSKSSKTQLLFLPKFSSFEEIYELIRAEEGGERLLENFSKEHTLPSGKFSSNASFFSLFCIAGRLLGTSSDFKKAGENLLLMASDFSGQKGVRIDYKMKDDFGLDGVKFVKSIISFVLAGAGEKNISFGCTESLAHFLSDFSYEKRDKFNIKNITLSGDLFYNKVVSNLIKKHLNPNIKTNFDPGFGVEIKL
ncbi:hypothetical protein [Campylobacter concisus]|uniref:hypothetical protein n=1 Tax=Campylobacter concisus TaxID=199 RepID=UPI000D319072|nr:hypothetical protein [Campylobacter concisus]